MKCKICGWPALPGDCICLTCLNPGVDWSEYFPVPAEMLPDPEVLYKLMQDKEDE